MSNSGSAASPALSQTSTAPSLRTLVTRYGILAVLLSVVLFAGSGRLNWARAWVYLGFTLGVQVVTGAMLYRRSPALLAERSRMQPGTKAWDKILAPLIALVGPIAIWVVAASDVRTHWPPEVDVRWSAVAFLVCALGSVVVSWAMATNPFFSATVRIQSERNQVVVANGPYRFVRHPGYCGAFAFTVASPVALGSWRAMTPALLTAGILVLRTALEDRVLRRELPGYADYAQRVRSRLAPGVW